MGASKAATAPLNLVPLDPDEPYFMLPEDQELYSSFEMSKHPQYKLVSSLDAIMLLKRDLGTLIAPSDQDHPVYTEKGDTQAAGSFSDAPFNAILYRGRLIGFWE